MALLEARKGRRSIRELTGRKVPRTDVEAMIDAGVAAPNHRLTQPWRFYVLGPQARHAYGAALGARKVKKLEDAAAAEALRTKIAEEHAALPLMIAVSVVEDAHPEIRQEDVDATIMALQDIALHATALGPA